MVENRNKNTENSRALIVGLGKSGIAAAEALKRLKADISVFDSHYSDAKASWAQKISGIAVSVRGRILSRILTWWC